MIQGKQSSTLNGTQRERKDNTKDAAFVWLLSDAHQATSGRAGVPRGRGRRRGETARATPRFAH